MKRRKITEQDKLEVKRLFDLGMGQKPIAKQLGFCRSSIRNICRELNLDSSSRYITRTTEENNKLLQQCNELYNTGHTSCEISDKLNISLKTINRLYKKLNINEPNIKGRWTQFSNQELNNIKQLYNDGLGQKAIADKLNVGRHIIISALQQLNIDCSLRNSKATEYFPSQGELDNIKKLYNKEFSIKDISRKLNMKKHYVKKACNILNLSISQRETTTRIFTEKELQQIKELFNNGQSFRQIRFILDIPYHHMVQAYKTLGLLDKKEKNIDILTQRKLRRSVSRAINQALKTKGSSKQGQSCLQYLPFNIIELKHQFESQFEPWMNWNNWTLYDPTTWDDNDSSTWTWNIDHIQPQSDFRYTSMNDPAFKECWALSNLRPYSAKQNIIDGPTRIRHKK